MLNNKFIILEEEVPPGSKAILYLEVAKLHTRTTINVPVIVERAKEDGPVLLLMAGVHGDEVNGVGIIREIIQKKYNKPKRGTVICIPVFNIFGYLMQTREFPDGRDLNRMFPGTSQGSLASQFAHLFTTEIAPLVDYVIDFHTGGGDRDNIAQIRCVLTEPKALELATVFGAPYLIHSNYINKSLRETMHKMGKTILLFEGGKSKNINSAITNSGVKGTLNVMKHLGMQDGEIENLVKSTVIKKTKWIRSPHSGMFRLKVKNGVRVSKKDLLGVIQDPFGEFERKIYAPFDCNIFCVNTTPIVNKGNALFHVSVEE